MIQVNFEVFCESFLRFTTNLRHFCNAFFLGKKLSLWPQGDDYGKYGVTQSNLKRAESHLKSSLQSAKVEAKRTSADQELCSRDFSFGNLDSEVQEIK